MYASYVAANQFRVVNDRTASFDFGRRVKADMGTDGTEYFTVESSSYASGVTTVTVIESTVTINLVKVVFGTVSAGLNGSLPTHTHADDDQGGPVILKSPDASQWKLVASDAGVVSVVSYP